MHWFKPNKKRRKYNPLLDHNYLLAKNNVVKKMNQPNINSVRRLSLVYASQVYNLKPLKYSF